MISADEVIDGKNVITKIETIPNNSSISKVWTFHYDDQGYLSYERFENLFSDQNTNYSDLKFSFDEHGNLTSVADYRNLLTEYEYNDAWKLTNIKLKDGSSLEEKRTGENGVYDRFSTDPLGYQTIITHGTNNGQPIKKIHQDGLMETYEYVGSGYVSKKTKFLENETIITAIEYDKKYQKTKEIIDPDGLNLVTEFAYDQFANIIQTTDPNGQVKHNIYDENSNLVQSIIDPLGLNLVTENIYNQFGQKIKTIDPEGFTTEWAYDAFGRIISTTDALGHVETRSYDVWGNLASVTDKNGNTTSYEYDALNRKVRSMDVMGYEELWQYDGNDNIVRYTDKNGALTAFEYNALNQNTRVGGDASAPGGSSCGCTGGTSVNGTEGLYEYDWKGNITKFTDAEGLVTVYEYDNMYRKIAEIKDPTGLNIQVRWEYDLLGRKIKETRVDNSSAEQYQITTFVYDKASRLIEQRRWLDSENYLVTKYSYDNMNHVIAVTDENGNISSREYDGAYRMIRSTDREGLVSKSHFNNRGELIQRVVDPEGLNIVTSTTYDALRRMVSTVEPDGGVSSRTYDPNGNLLTSTDPLGQVTSYEYDARNQMIRTVDALGHVTTFQVDGLGNRVKTTDANGTVTKTIYDLKSFAEQTIEDFGGISRTTNYERDKLMHPVTSIDAFGTVSLTEYDAVYRPLLRIADATGKMVVSETVYDSLSRVVAVIDAGGFETQFEYDNLGRRVREILPDGGEASYTYDNVGNVLVKIQKVSTTGQVLVTRYSYDKENRLLSTTEDAEGLAIITTRAYDALGRLASITDAKGAVTSYAYNEENHITLERYADGGEVHMSYDLKGRLVERRDQNNAVTQYFYDARDLLVRKTYGNGGEQTFEYDALRRLLRDTDNNEGSLVVSTDYTYDALHRQLTSTQRLGSSPAQTLSKVFDAYGHEVECHHPSGRVVRKTYTALHQVDQIFTRTGDGVEMLVTDYNYEYDDTDSDKRMVLVGQEYPGSTGIQLNVQVDSMGRTTSRVYEQWGSPLVGFEHDYNLLGNRTRDSHLHKPNDSETYNYDTAQRFNAYGRDGGEAQSWQLDKLGNWVQFDDNGNVETRTHNLVNEVTSISPDKALNYDDNGNMTFYSGKNFVWDANNRLTHVYSTSIPGQIARYYYSAMNNRVKKTIDSDGDGLLDESTVYIYCGQKVCEEQDENGGFKRDYIHGGQFIDEIVMTCDSPSGLGSFSLTDLRYSVYAVVDSSGVILERYQYDPYGKRKVMNAGYGEMVESGIGQEFGYTGRRHDSEATGLMYFRARMYSCDLGRFIGRDPIGYRGGGMSLYRGYFAVNGVDWNGLECQGCNIDEVSIVSNPGNNPGELLAPYSVTGSFKDELIGDILMVPSCCELKQYVRGGFYYNGNLVPHGLSGGSLLSTTEFGDDGLGFTGNGTYNDNPGLYNLVVGHQTTINGESVTFQFGDEFSFWLDIKIKVMDLCRNNPDGTQVFVGEYNLSIAGEIELGTPGQIATVGL